MNLFPSITGQGAGGTSASPIAQYPFTGIPVGGCTGAAIAYRDPFEYATETALAQPADKQWRRFQHALFQLRDVASVIGEGSGTIRLHLRMCEGDATTVWFTLPFECDDPVQWFAEHVLQMDFPNAKRAT